MAAYGALVSLMYIIKQIQQHPLLPISLNEKQVDSLTENVSFLQRFLEDNYSSSGSKEEDEELESRIAEAAYAAEDVIESHIVDQIHAGSTTHGAKSSSVDNQFYQDLQKVIQDTDLIKKEVIEIIKEMGAQDPLHRNSPISIGSPRPASTWQNNTMVGFDDVLIEVMDKLTGEPNGLQIIPIVGMGGIGKTTLARNIYANSLIVKHFDFLAWVTISQEFSRREILLVLCQETKKWSMESLHHMKEDKLGEMLRKHLWGRRYLIVMDDIWSIEAWDGVKSFFPDNNNGSRIMVTTRLSNLDFQLSGFRDFQIKFLEDDESWNLLCEIVFGKEDCPIELENIGKEIARNCRGLPLSIVVIGGLLTKSKMTVEYWEDTLKDLNSLINLENNEHCLQILGKSYKELPIHLKPCFLYMGIFPEDDEIVVSQVIKLWVVEGFLRPVDGKSLEVVAKEYFEELFDRNLILVHKMRWNGKVKLCKIHDLLRDLCLREAQKQKFLCILRQQELKIPEGINIQRRICIFEDSLYAIEFDDAMKSASLIRSLLLVRRSNVYSPPLTFRLLRVYSKIGKRINVGGEYSIEAIFRQANLRYLSITANISGFPSSLSPLWNLQTLEVSSYHGVKPIIVQFEIWKMPLLRHVVFKDGLELPDPHIQEDIVLENLQTLSCIHDFKCSEEVVKRIPNIKKLKLLYWRLDQKEGSSNYCLNNLGRLQKLESLFLTVGTSINSDPEILRIQLVQNLTLPHSLKKLTLRNARLNWEDLMTKIGSLPHLEVLKLQLAACLGVEWETVEEKFCSLKILEIENSNLKYWTTDNTHFPRLEHLVLRYLQSLEEVPSSIGDIPTLKSIQLEYCSKSAADSAERIKEEQEGYGNEDLKVLTVHCLY